jgi:hypothetical protein
MRSVEVIVSCDVCFDETQTKVQATGTLVYGLTYGGGASRVIELCDEHLGSVSVADLINADQMIGKPYVPTAGDKPPRATRGAPRGEDLQEVACPFCQSWYKEGTGIAIHVRSTHPEYFQTKTDWSRVTFDGKRVKVA